MKKYKKEEEVKREILYLINGSKVLLTHWANNGTHLFGTLLDKYNGNTSISVYVPKSYLRKNNVLDQ